MSWEIALREKSELGDLLERRVREKEANDETREVGQGQILKGVCTGYRVDLCGCSGQPMKVLFLHQSFQKLS